MEPALRMHRLAVIAVLLLGVLAPGMVAAQSQLDTTEAQTFIGEWDLALQTEMGPFNLALDIEDRDGKVIATLGSPDQGGSQEISDISRSGENLVMRYEMEAQGQEVAVSVTLTREGERLNAELDFAEGMFIASGVAIRADG